MASTARALDRQLYSDRDALSALIPPSRSVVHDQARFFAQRFRPPSLNAALPASVVPAQSQVIPRIDLLETTLIPTQRAGAPRPALHQGKGDDPDGGQQHGEGGQPRQVLRHGRDAGVGQGAARMSRMAYV